MSEQRYDLILGRDLTCHEPVRRKYYRYMVVYLVFAGLMLAEGGYQVSKRFSQVRNASGTMKEFVGGMPSLRMKESMVMGTSQKMNLSALSAKATVSIPFLQVFKEIYISLPKGTQIESVKMENNTVGVVIRIWDRSHVLPSDYLADLRKNKELLRYVKEIKQTQQNTGVEDNQKWVDIYCEAEVKNR